MIWILFFVKNISKILSSKYSQKLIDHAKQSATDMLKTTSEGTVCYYHVTHAFHSITALYS